MDNIFTVIVALVAIVSPVITTVLNHKFEVKVIKMKRDDQKEEIIEAFLSELLDLGSRSIVQFDGLSKKALSVSRYFPERTNTELMRLVASLSNEKLKYERNFPGEDSTFGNCYLEVITSKEHPENYLCGEMTSLHAIVNHFIKETQKL